MPRRFPALLSAVLPSSFVAILTISMTVPPGGASYAQTRRSPESTVRTYQLRGSVRSAFNDLAIEMVRVDLKMFTGETVSSSITRSNGEFEFSGLRSGEYYLEISHHGYEPLRERIEVMNTSRAGIFLFIKPLDAPQVSKDPAVSARELAIPRKATDSFNKGMDQLLLKHAAEASLRHFDKAISLLDTYYEAHHMRGIAYFQLGRFEEAEREFRTSLEKSGNQYPEPYFGLAALLMAQNNYTAAVDSIRQGLAIEPNSWRGHLELARAQMGLSQIPEAAASIERARQIKPDFPDIHLISANINMRRQDGPALLRDLDEYLKLKPEGPQADQAKKMRDAIRMRMAAAETQQGTPPPAKKPQ